MMGYARICWKMEEKAFTLSFLGKGKEIHVSAATVRMRYHSIIYTNIYVIGESRWQLVQSVIEDHIDTGLWNQRENHTRGNSEL